MHAFNKDGDSYRSPWTNTFYPAKDSATNYPSYNLLTLEQKANSIFEQYVQMYYDEAISSVYLTQTLGEGFKAFFLVKKEIKDSFGIKEGSLDVAHQVTSSIYRQNNKTDYFLISYMMLRLNVEGFENNEIKGTCSKISS